jgi:hypothetical protein
MKDFQLKIDAFDGEGLKWAFDNGSWVVGIKNYKPQNDLKGFDCLERHNETDELFVLLDGECCLVLGEKAGNGHPAAFEGILMVPQRVYTIPRGAWHTTVTKPGVKLILIEKSGTSMANSEIWNFAGAEAGAAADIVKKAGW